MSARSSMKNKQLLGALLIGVSLLVSACGERTSGDSPQVTFNANGTTDSGGEPAVAQALPDTLSLRVVSDVNSISTGGIDVANITALVSDMNNNALATQPVTFSSTGGVLQNISTETDENGEATATLRLPQDFQNQDIIVTVSAENSSADVKVTAHGSVLDVSGPDTLVLGNKAEIILILTAGNGEPIANEVITVDSAAGNTIEPELSITDASGRATLMVGSDNANDTVRVSALNGTVNASHSFEVASDVLQFDDEVRDAELAVAEDNIIAVTWFSQGQPVAHQPLRFSTTAGEIVDFSTVFTNATGRATIKLRSSSAGPATLSVESASFGSPSTSVDIEFVAVTPDQVTIDASSSRIDTNGSSTITALVTDINGNPVKNKTVDFTSADLKGGQLNPASATTNSSGVASVVFTAGDNATEEDEIVISARVKSTLIADVMALTVFKRALNVTIGTSNEINIKPLGTQYAMPFIVQVADGSGTPIENASVRMSIRPISYGKGYMVLVNDDGLEYAADIDNWSADRWTLASNSIVCVSEDANGNRVLDADGVTTEDTNGNGSLDPQDPASLTAIEGGLATISGGVVNTDMNGSGYFEMIYPASNSAWAFVEITARAEALGAEAEDSFSTFLALPASEINAIDELPANHVSPYGTVLSCNSPD